MQAGRQIGQFRIGVVIHHVPKGGIVKSTSSPLRPPEAGHDDVRIALDQFTAHEVMGLIGRKIPRLGAGTRGDRLVAEIGAIGELVGRFFGGLGPGASV